jgi:hypothetical protein
MIYFYYFCNTVRDGFHQMSWNSKFPYSYIACCWLGRVTQPCMTWHLLNSSKDNPPCSELRGSLLCLQEPTIASYAEPDKPSLHTPYLFIIQKHVFQLHLGHWRYVFLKVSGERVFFCVFRTYHMQTACFIHAILDLMSLIIFCETVCVGNFVFHPQKRTQAKRVWGTGVDPRERKWRGNGKNYFVSSFMICAVRDLYTNEISGLLFIVNLDWLIVWRSACQQVLCSTRVYLVCSENFRHKACSYGPSSHWSLSSSTYYTVQQISLYPTVNT